MTTIGMIVLMFGAFYFLVIRPQRKRQAQQRETIESLRPGARVLTSTGIYGTLVRIGEKQAVIELSPGHEMTVVKHAIVRAIEPGDEDLEMDSGSYTPGGGMDDALGDEEAASRDASDDRDDDFPWADDDRRDGGA